MKPTLKKRPAWLYPPRIPGHQLVWVCETTGVYGAGRTPKEAYETWQVKNKRRASGKIARILDDWQGLKG